MGTRKAAPVLPSTAPDESGLDAHRDSLERRLDDGYCRIEQAAFAGTDVSEWESFWIRLLGEYEDVCRKLDLAA